MNVNNYNTNDDKKPLPCKFGCGAYLKVMFDSVREISYCIEVQTGQEHHCPNVRCSSEYIPEFKTAWEMLVENHNTEFFNIVKRLEAFNKTYLSEEK